MLWHMLSRPGMDVSPFAWAALMSWRAISGRGQPRASRCCRNQAPSSFGITPSFAVWTFTDTRCVRECPYVSSVPLTGDGGGRWSGEEAVGEAGLGAVDERADLAGLQDEGGAVRVGGLAQGDPAAGECLGFQAGAAAVAPWLVPAAGAEVCRAHAVMDVHGFRSPYWCRGGC